jgi:hypothetical protein
LYSVLFWKDAAERAIATGIQALLALVLAGPAFNVFDFDWNSALVVVASAAVLSVVKSLAANALTNNSVSPASLVTDDHKAV